MITYLINHWNWIDWLVLAGVVYFVYAGRGRGLLAILFQAVGFVGSLWVAVRSYAMVGESLGEKFGVTGGWGKLVGFVAVALASEWVISEAMQRVYGKLPEGWMRSRWNTWLGVIPSAVNGLIAGSFVMLLILGLPVRGSVKGDIRSSSLGNWLVEQARRVERNARSIFGEALSEVVRFTTVKPGSSERVELAYEVSSEELWVDIASEEKMLLALNLERERAGAGKLTLNKKMTEVAREHSRDMWERSYFSHVNPDGKDPFDRMRAGGVDYQMAGENLALSPDVGVAMEGLMDSPGHKRNILDPAFGRVGVGIVDGGIYGKMFTQVFAD